MKAESLPRKLGKEPLIDVVCEVRFDASAHAGSLLPGLILAKLGDQPSQIEAMPASQLPKAIRDQDPNFRYAALMRIVAGDRFAILISDNSLAVACKMPYAGWQDFKNIILHVFSVLADVDFVKKIERHSMKYVDLFERDENAENVLNQFNLSLNVAKTELTNEPVNLRVEIPKPPFLHALGIVTPAAVKMENGTQRSGTVIDVDTYRVQEYQDIKQFYSNLGVLLEEIHSANKHFFFSLISPSGLAKLEPIYD